MVFYSGSVMTKRKRDRLSSSESKKAQLNCAKKAADDSTCLHDCSLVHVVYSATQNSLCRRCAS